jgi:hypothetical protein
LKWKSAPVSSKTVGLISIWTHPEVIERISLRQHIQYLNDA